MANAFRRKPGLPDDCRGVAAIEYALIASMLVVGIVASFPLLRPALNGAFTTIAGDFAAIK